MTEPPGVHGESVPDAGLHLLIVPVMKALVPVEIELERPPAPAEAPIREPYIGDLYISYAFELPDRYEFLTQRHCAELGLAPSGLRALASQNLRTRRPGLALNWFQDAKAVSVFLGSDLEAGLLLDDGIMVKLAQDLTGDLVVAIPSRDVFLATGTGHPDGMEKLHWAVEQVWSTSGEHLLTRDLLVRDRDSWRILTRA